MLQISAVLESYMIDDIATEGLGSALKGIGEKIVSAVKAAIKWLGERIVALKNLILGKGGAAFAKADRIAKRELKSLPGMVNEANLTVIKAYALMSTNGKAIASNEQIVNKVAALKETFDDQKDKIDDAFAKISGNNSEKSYVSKGTAQKLMDALSKYEDQLKEIEKNAERVFGVLMESNRATDSKKDSEKDMTMDGAAVGHKIGSMIATMATTMITNITKATNVITSMIKASANAPAEA